MKFPSGFHKINDMFGQDIINQAYEKAWDSGKSKPTLNELNKAWTKASGRDNPYKKLPKYDAKRGSGGREGFGKFLNELFE